MFTSTLESCLPNINRTKQKDIWLVQRHGGGGCGDRGQPKGHYQEKHIHKMTKRQEQRTHKTKGDNDT